MSLDADEAEHSLEMHLPYVRKIFEGYVLARSSQQKQALICGQ
jgi:predicted class III extradiol MEMO1 family dioxygenase